MKKRSDGGKRDRFMCQWKPYLCYFSEKKKKESRKWAETKTKEEEEKLKWDERRHKHWNI